jgi:hypothetical protein
MSESLSRWELAEYISTGLVTLACIGEYIADFTNWFTGGEKGRKERLTKASTLLLIAALAAELLCVVRTNQLSGGVIESLGDKATEADGKARQALTDSGSALTKSAQALAVSGLSKDSADSAGKEADQALNGATLDAARVAVLNGKLADRTLTDAQVATLVGKLINFPSQEFEMLPYWNSPESMGIYKRIGDALLSAKWSYVPYTGYTSLPPGVVGIKVFIDTKASRSTREAGEELIKLLRGVGLQCDKYSPESAGAHPQRITIEIGAKR